ncbi:hypothetical protein CABS01_16514, partial [Colletotrichum abscissum]|uniref:uncharacterized protein n=1 Tax=Colletotrichum abscissum TaxID=1671311 RepID=UPI0027D567AE
LQSNPRPRKEARYVRVALTLLDRRLTPADLSGRPSGIVKPEKNLQVNVGDRLSGSQGPRGIVHDSNMNTTYSTSGSLPTVKIEAQSLLPADQTKSSRVVKRKERTPAASSSQLMPSKIQKKPRPQPPSETLTQKLGSQIRYRPFPVRLVDDTNGV